MAPSIKKRKLSIVDIVENTEFKGSHIYDEIIKEIQKLDRSRGHVPYSPELFDTLDELYKTNNHRMAGKLAERARLLVASARSAVQAARLEKLADFLQERGVEAQDPELIEKSGKLMEKVKEMKEAPAALARPVQKTKPAKQSKTPVFKDSNKQKEIKLKYGWVQENSFRQDPEKEGGTILDIKCQKCGEPRTVHLYDAFQCKVCLRCKGFIKSRH